MNRTLNMNEKKKKKKKQNSKISQVMKIMIRLKFAEVAVSEWVINGIILFDIISGDFHFHFRSLARRIEISQQKKKK